MAALESGIVVGGKYRLDTPIGRGGMASVWRAIHTTLESPVAVKFLETFGTSRDNMAKRFLREAKLAGGLRHRNVVHILDYGVMDDGQPFMVMELLEGMSLADRFDNGPKLRDLELLDIVSKVLSGLAVVHESGIVHRDIKPDNIFLVSDADGEYPKLLDFGISRGLGVDPSDTRVTSTGAVIGTPLYMSPEQARGMKDIDQRTDLWSVGMILWEGLTGILPFDSEHMGDVLIRIATEDAPSIGDHRDDLPAELVDLIGKVLQRDRSARFTSAREMREAVLAAADLIAAGAGTPRRRDPSTALAKPIAAKPSAAARAKTGEIVRERSRWPLLLGIGAAALSAAVVGFIALGGEIRFSSASAEPEPGAAPAVEAPIEPVAPVAPIVAAEPVAPVVAAPVVQEPVVPEPVVPEPAEQAAAAQAAVAAQEPAPARSGTRRPPRRSTPTAEARPPEPREPAAPARRPTEATTREGGFLRDLDY